MMTKPSQHQYLKAIASTFLLLSCVASQTIYDLTGASEGEPMIFSCSDHGEGCGVRGQGRWWSASPIAFCSSSSSGGGVAAWAPTSIDETSDFIECTAGRCTAVCEPSCSCTLKDGSDCPTTDERADLNPDWAGKVPLLPDYCNDQTGFAGPPLGERFGSDYSSERCSDLMGQSLPTTCPCTFNFCNGEFVGCDRDWAGGCSYWPTFGQTGQESCVLADQICPSSEPAPPTPTPPTGGSSLRPSSAPTPQPTSTSTPMPTKDDDSSAAYFRYFASIASKIVLLPVLMLI